MRLATMVQIFFIIYCFEAGLLLLILPWHPFWDGAVMQMAAGGLRTLLLHPMLRGAVSGFGLIHLVWGLHDALVLHNRRSPDAGAGL